MAEFEIDLPEPEEGHEWKAVESQALLEGDHHYVIFHQVKKHKEPELVYRLSVNHNWQITKHGIGKNSGWYPVRRLQGTMICIGGINYDRMIITDGHGLEVFCIGYWNDGPKEPGE